MSRPSTSTPTSTNKNLKSRSFRDLGDLDYDYGLDLTSPLSPPLPLPPPPSRSYTDELSKKSVPVPATPVIRLLAPTPEATSPRILLHPRRAGFRDEDDDEPFPEFLDPLDTAPAATASLPSSRYDGSGNSSSNASGFNYTVPWTDELTRTSSRRHRRPSQVQQSVFEEDTSSSSSSSSDDDTFFDCSSPTSQAGHETTDNGSKARTNAETGEERKDGECEDKRKSGASASRDLTTFRFPKAEAGGQRRLD
ncbi:hypothetical protein PG993_000207 [Apiospora rasikravindrae]|uniref:Uncharacterized protein n=1 Tax=Apiospora rasikravindrae TaxID=990691 RepID=A0ABR1UA59_9PEZI